MIYFLAWLYLTGYFLDLAHSQNVFGKVSKAEIIGALFWPIISTIAMVMNLFKFNKEK